MKAALSVCSSACYGSFMQLQASSEAKNWQAASSKDKVMATAVAEYTAEEVARLGDQIYERDIRPLVEAENKGKIVALDVRSGAYELADDILTSGLRLRERLPAAEIWFVRVGHSAVHHLPHRAPSS